ncbi:MAG: response regulator [Candidatus Nitrohelix vancouverensis]|uniref:Response regulator n=1 Tax=Candidatus Nitrohelix vancouverensis TaxID=2705534 RepID=A0A7T0C4T0_9BACT|nr:MAG: response regulator [Candidatus Nitrohelix vancouverensis]
MPDHFSDKQALVADNSSVMTRIIKNNLVSLGFTPENVVVVSDGNQANLMLGLSDFHLLITGYHMKFMNGVELAIAVRTNSSDAIKNIRHLIITAETKSNIVDQFAPAGCNGYINKPFTFKTFQSKIHEVFGLEADTKEEEAISEKSSVSSSTESDLKVDPKIVSAFSESAIESLGQYMVSAVAGKPTNSLDGSFYFGSLVNLNDPAHSTQVNVALYFPKDVACSIYEGIFGEVDIEQVCGVVQELANIIGGIVKPKISGLTQEIVSLVNAEAVDEQELDFQLGLPEAKMGEDYKFDINGDDSSNFIIPFQVNDDSILMEVQIAKS